MCMCVNFRWHVAARRRNQIIFAVFGAPIHGIVDFRGINPQPGSIAHDRHLPHRFPPHRHRAWLAQLANQVVLTSPERNVLIDSGYAVMRSAPSGMWRKRSVRNLASIAEHPLP